MPVYEYVCVDCKKKFCKVRRISAYKKAVKCPKCNSQHVERRWSSISVATSTKS